MTFRILAAATAVSALAVAAHAQDRTEINFWHAMGGDLGERTDEFATAFNGLQDSCTVNSVYQGNYTETLTTAVAAFRAGEQPHIVQVFEVGTATMMAAEGAVYPVYELFADAGMEFDPSRYVPGVISYYSDTEGRMLSLPYNSSTPVMWINVDAFEEAGLEIPTTWDEVEAAARAFQETGVAAPLSFGWQSWVMLENFGAWHDIPFATQANGFAGTDAELVFNAEPFVNHIQRLADMSAEGLFVYGGRRGDSAAMFHSGDTPMYLNSSAFFGNFTQNADFEFTQVMMPLDSSIADAPQNSIIGGATLWTLRGHEPAEYTCVAEFLNYLSETEVQADWAQATGYVPITTAAAELMETRGFYAENPGTNIAVEQLSLNAPTANSSGVRLGNFVQIRDVINEELEAVWAGNKTAQEALDTAVARGNDLLRRFEAAN
jgi:sn-glycerol 3-phosphate transport system substrate-binding protein